MTIDFGDRMESEKQEIMGLLQYLDLHGGFVTNRILSRVHDRSKFVIDTGLGVDQAEERLQIILALLADQFLIQWFSHKGYIKITDKGRQEAREDWQKSRDSSML